MKYFKKNTVIKIAITLSIIASAILLPSQSYASPVVGFDAGNIIDDIVFTYSKSMNVTQIQTFLNSKVPVCDTWGTYGSTPTSRANYIISIGQTLPLTCLKDLQENGKSSAQIIYDAAQEYQINPQVLIVLLQKEQGLVTDDWPDARQYRSATGYGCPDGAACDSQYYGFTNQVRNAARMFRAILNDSPTWYTPYETGNNYILYNPASYCGGSNVYIKNRSTQALYNYTPYQPNAEALAAGYGDGNSCSAHGNRNFYLYFSDWFGSTHRRLITSQSKGVYTVENGEKRAFPSETIFLSYSYKWSDVLTISSDEISSIPDGTDIAYNTHYRDNYLVTAPNKGVYLIQDGTKRAFPSEDLFNIYGYKWSDIISISDYELLMIPDGSSIQYDVHFRDGKIIAAANLGVYLIENGTKRAFPREDIFFSNSHTWSDVIIVKNSELTMIPDGPSMPYNANYRNGKLVTIDNKGMYLIENGTKRAFPDEQTFFSYLYKWSDVINIKSAEFDQIPDGTAMTYNVSYRDNKVVTTATKGVYFIKNGTKRAFPDEQTFFSYLYKWSDLIKIADAELNSIPDGTAMTYNVHYRDGQLLKSSINGGVYLVENGLKRAFPNEATFFSYAYKWPSVNLISAYELTLIPEGLAMNAKS